MSDADMGSKLRQGFEWAGVATSKIKIKNLPITLNLQGRFIRQFLASWGTFIGSTEKKEGTGMILSLFTFPHPKARDALVPP